MQFELVFFVHRFIVSKKTFQTYQLRSSERDKSCSAGAESKNTFSQVKPSIAWRLFRRLYIIHGMYANPWKFQEISNRTHGPRTPRPECHIALETYWTGLLGFGPIQFLMEKIAQSSRDEKWWTDRWITSSDHGNYPGLKEINQCKVAGCRVKHPCKKQVHSPEPIGGSNRGFLGNNHNC